MLFLVRHAHSDWIPDEMRSLSPAGHAAAKRIADLLAPQAIARIYASPYTRAIQTVQPLASRLGLFIHVDHDLRERDLSTEPVRDFKAAIEATWRDFTFAHPGGESSAQAQERVARAIARIAQTAAGRNAVISSHGNAVALYLRTLDPAIDFNFWAAMSTPDIFVIEWGETNAVSYRRLWEEHQV
jgi:broad specificity phosphatase PhoE